MTNESFTMLFKTDSLLDFLQEFDKFIEIYGVHRGNERAVAIAFFHSFMPWISCLRESDRRRIENEIVVFRNIRLDKNDVERIYEGLRVGKTELDLFFINVPTIFGHRAGLNFYIEIEMSRDITTELARLVQLRSFFKKLNKKLYTVLVTPNVDENYFYDEFKTYIYKFDYIKKIAYLMKISSLKDIPGIAYDPSATSLFLLDYIAQREGKENETKTFIRKLWNNAPELIQMDFRKYFYNGVLEKEDFNFSFMLRINGILKKLKKRGLIEEKDKAYRLTINGRDLLIYLYNLLKV